MFKSSFMRHVAAGLVAFAVCTSLYADETGKLPSRLTLNDAKKMALKDNPDLQTTLERIHAAAARINEARGSYLPSVGVFADGRRQINTPETTKGMTHTDAYSMFDAGLSANYTLFDGLSRRFKLIEKELAEQIVQNNHADAERKLLLAVSAAYFDALLERQNVIIAIEDLDYNKKLEDNAEKKRVRGAGSRSDVLNFEIQAKNAEASKNQAECNYSTAILALGELLGVNPPDSPKDVELDPVQDYLKAAPIPMFEVLLETALTQRPDLKSADLSIKQQEAIERQYRGEYMPTLTASATYGFSKRNNMHFRNEQTDAQIGLSLSWNVFNGGQTRAKIAAAYAERLASEAQRKSLLLAIRHDIARQLVVIQNAKEQADLKDATQKLAMQARDLVQKEYDNGRVTATRLNEAQTDLTNAQGAYAKAVINYWLYRENLDADTGAILQIK